MKKTRYKGASQWFQAIISLFVLTCFYVSRDHFSGDVDDSAGPTTAPITSWKQVQYWEGDTTGFASGHTEVATDSQISLDSEGVIYDSDGVKISFFRETDTTKIESQVHSDLPRFYTQVDTGTLLVEGDISSHRVGSILAQIQSL